MSCLFIFSWEIFHWGGAMEFDSSLTGRTCLPRRDTTSLRSEKDTVLLPLIVHHHHHHHHHHHYHHHHLFLNRVCRWGTTDDFATSFLHSSLFFTAFWDLANSRPGHSRMWSSYLFLFLPCLLSPYTVPCKVVLARPDERETWLYHCSLRLFTMVRTSSCCSIACWILARTSSLVTWSLYEMCSILR